MSELFDLDLFDEQCVGVLSREWKWRREEFMDGSAEEMRESEKKIRNKLKYRKIKYYDEARVAHLRELVHELQTEILLGLDSKYFDWENYATRREKGDVYAKWNDFDGELLSKHMHEKYADVSLSIIRKAVSWVVYYWYLR